MKLARLTRNLIASIGFALLAHPLAVQAEVKIGVSDWPGWVAWYIAEQKGYFKKHGADVKLVWFANYTDSISALSAGQVDANSQTWSDTMAPLAMGVPLKVILVNDNSAGNDALMVSPKIKSFKDLKGKRIALEEFSISHFLLTMALNKNGMSLKDVKVINLSAGDAAAAFLAGRVDAAVVWNPVGQHHPDQRQGQALVHFRGCPRHGARPAGSAGKVAEGQAQGFRRHGQGLVRRRGFPAQQPG
jgi:NitT/TauT family transport system substrate-binding protein